MRIRGSEMVRATRTPEGPASMWLRHSPSSAEVTAQAWGSGADWALAALPDLIGEGDDPTPLGRLIDRSTGPEKPLLRDLYRQLEGMRMPRSRAVLEAAVATILEQKVAGPEARRSYRQMLFRLGEPTPGPPEIFRDMRVPPGAETLKATPYWVFHEFGVEMKRARPVRAAANHAGRLEELAECPPEEARLMLTLIPGIGEWTAAEVALVAFGDPDAVSVGDYHIPHQVTWAFTRVPRGDDETMLRLLEPYRGQRGRVIRLLQAGGIMPPRFGPRQPLRNFRRQ